MCKNAGWLSKIKRGNFLQCLPDSFAMNVGLRDRQVEKRQFQSRKKRHVDQCVGKFTAKNTARYINVGISDLGAGVAARKGNRSVTPFFEGFEQAIILNPMN
ncbi:MAG TPA: hypothetical protein PLR50_06395 [Candidatus Rifleibacterium sp.]|nr:hypothetical protein [Candidatus Rifleibacterium sp.]